MIRPFTLICMVSAFGAGLYLYQSKHHAQVLDREIMRTIKQTEATRERTGMLRAEWALLNEPDRLAELAKAHTSLQTLKPTQFVALAELSTRLPAPVAPHEEKLPLEAQPEEPVAIPVAQAAPTPVPVPTPAAVPAVKPREAPVAVAEAKPKVEPKVEPKPVAVVAETKPITRPVERPVARAPVQLATESAPPPVRASRSRPPADVASNEATAPGTVGAAVLRAMRAQNGGYAQGASPAPAPQRVYSQQPAYVQPAYAQPAYAPPAYAQPAYAQPTYAAPSASMLGGHTALPPPVPFASR